MAAPRLTAPRRRNRTRDQHNNQQTDGPRNILPPTNLQAQECTYGHEPSDQFKIGRAIVRREPRPLLPD